MKRFHVHVAVDDIEANVRFYSSVFGVAPSMRKDDYAKWMLDDPRINFAISRRGAKAGVDHLGIQVESDDELQALRQQVAQAEIAAFDQAQAQCCYAKSDKYWIADPQGIAWETYHTLEQVEVYGKDTTKSAPAPVAAASTSCCAPRPEVAPVQMPTSKKSACC